MTELPILYSFRRCPYAMRARLAILSSGVSVELREIVLRDKAPEFLAVSPSKTVPCLVESGTNVIDESFDIMLWALEQRDPEGWLTPEEGTLEDMVALANALDGDFKRHLDRYKYDTRHPDASREGEREAASSILRDIEQRLTRSPWLFGSRASLADYAFLPFLRQFANVDRQWFDGEPWPNLRRRLSDFEASVRFQSIMAKLPKWQSGDTVLVFP
ncbi:glutathione S-transferase [Roseibium sp.]|uniref:glutathione S-transferase n=1 Tax=Roseibium sp. TaxID=1936156 RepID=UPI003A96FD49